MNRSIPFAVFLLVMASAACGGEDAQAPPGGAGPGAFPPAEVKTISLEPKPLPQSSEFVATIRSLRSTTVQPQVEGIVRQVFVRAGDAVRAGQPIIQIDPDKQQATVTASESQRASREADLAFAGQQLARMQKLFEAGAVSRAELEQAETAQKTAQAQLAAVQSQIRENEVQLGYYRVTAPTAGIIGDIPVRQGDRVTPATVITTLDQPQGLEAYINVPLERSAELRPGLTVELLDSADMVIATNPITFIAPRADDATQSVLVKATLRQMPVGIRVMQYVRARIIWNNDPGMTVPVVAVNRLAGQYFVFVAESMEQGFVARQKPITVGEVLGDDYVVRGGLMPGERVIVSNIQKIFDGAPVKPS
jgi:RND family efflux transporter MFP subunit